MNNPVQKAINIVGTQAELAKRCNVWQQTVSKWLYRGSVPIKSVGKVVAAIDGQIPAEELCPEIKNLLRASRVCEKL
jgi:DNA-binding transcriptional regulator YdaS (Cro superfamily)